MADVQTTVRTPQPWRLLLATVEVWPAVLQLPSALLALMHQVVSCYGAAEVPGGDPELALTLFLAVVSPLGLGAWQLHIRLP